MDYSHYRSLRVEIHDGVATVTLNKPDSRNAVDGAMHKELASIFTDLENDIAVEIIVLTGAGKAFCGGGDLAWMEESVDDPERFEIVVRETKQIILAMLDAEKPLVSKVNGHAMGLGATLALFCDVIFAADHAKIGDPHVLAGLVAADGGAVIWPQLIGFARAKEYLMTGKPISAAEAERIGLINRAVPSVELDAVVQEFIADIRAASYKAVKWTKTTINLQLKQIANTLLDAGLAYEVVTNASSDHAEAVRAFKGGRKPQFRRPSSVT